MLAKNRTQLESIVEVLIMNSSSTTSTTSEPLTKPTLPSMSDDITVDLIIETLQQSKSWEDRYRQLIIWGRTLASMDEALKKDQIKISGCESQVWLMTEQVGDKYYFHIDSDARIVRGLIVVILAAFNGKTAVEIAQFDVENYFEQLKLMTHLSPSRSNGLYAIVERIKTLK